MKDEHSNLTITLGRTATVIHGKNEFCPSVHGDMNLKEQTTIELGDMTSEVWTMGGSKILHKVATRKICAYFKGQRDNDDKISLRLSLCKTSDTAVLWEKWISIKHVGGGCYRRTAE